MNIDVKILNTPITPEKINIEIKDGEYKYYLQSEWNNYCGVLERMRKVAKETKNPEVLRHLKLMIPECLINKRNL